MPDLENRRVSAPSSKEIGIVTGLVELGGARVISIFPKAALAAETPLCTNAATDSEKQHGMACLNPAARPELAEPSVVTEAAAGFTGTLVIENDPCLPDHPVVVHR